MPVPLADLWRSDPELREIVIDGLLRRGQVGNLISTSKAYKTFLILLLALCMAMRRPWLGFNTIGGRVLLLDLELQRPDITHRTHAIATAIGAAPEVAAMIDVLPLRGRNATIDGIEPMLLALAPRTYSLVILDPLYKTYPAQFDENSNAQMTALYRRFERIAEHLDAAFFVVHHATKGSQSEKRVVDVGAGAGSQSRSADAHIALREHNEDNCVVLDARVRSFKPVAPIVLRFDYPVWTLAPDLDPEALKTGRASRIADTAESRAQKVKPEPWTVARFVQQFLTSEPLDKAVIVARARQLGLKNREITDLLAIGQTEHVIFRWSFEGNRSVYLANSAQPVLTHTHTRPPTPPGSAKALPGLG
jgi:hypothetical protein